MKLEFSVEGIKYEFDAAKPLDISLRLSFEGPQPNAYGVARAKASVVRVAEFVGDTREGGSCNCEEYTLIPHCHGTHTECLGHIVNERICAAALLSLEVAPATLISVTPQLGKYVTETYSPRISDEDLVITASSLMHALAGSAKPFTKALLIRTLPNDSAKCFRNYSSDAAPYLSREASELVLALQVSHLLIDIPSIDRASDEGLLTNHHLFWEVTEGAKSIGAKRRSDKTITEMIYVPNEISDGTYVLGLATANFESDAAPSRAVLYEIEECTG